MELFLSIVTTFPTVLYSGILILSCLYWCLSFVGAVDLDMLDAVDGADGLLESADGVLEAADGALEGMDGAIEGADGALEGAEMAGELGAGEVALVPISGGFSLVGALKLRVLPLTITMSLINLWAFALSYIGVRFFMPILGFTGLLGELVIGGCAFAGAVLVNSVVLGPLEGKFKPTSAQERSTFIGQMAKIITGKVTDGFGEATFRGRDNVPLLLQVRCDHPNTLTKNDEVLLISLDKTRNAYVVEPLKRSSK